MGHEQPGFVGFGEGDFVGGIFPEDSPFWELDGRGQALYLARRNGCPVAEHLTDPANPGPGRGPENMIRRYGEVNFWYGQIFRIAGELNNRNLMYQLQYPERREANQPLLEGSYEPQSVPDRYLHEMSPMNTLTGYALPRLFVRQLGDSTLPLEERRRRLDRGLSVLEQAITGDGTPEVPAAETPVELLARLAEGLSTEDVHPVDALRDSFSAAWLKEQNAPHLLDYTKAAFEAEAPQLWTFYMRLDETEKTRLGLA